MFYEEQVRDINEEFYELILPYISSLPDLRPQKTLKKMSDRESVQNSWRILAEELDALLHVSGEEENEERDLWLLLSNGDNSLWYVDEKREITDRFIEKYSIIFLLLLRATPNSTVPLLSSTRENLFNTYDFLQDEMRKYNHTVFLIRDPSFLPKGFTVPSYTDIQLFSSELASSLLVHFLLSLTHLMDYKEIFVNRYFGLPSTIPTVEERLSLIEMYQNQMTITETALCYLGLTYDIMYGQEGHIPEDLLLYLVSSSSYQEVLSDPRAVSIKKRDFKVIIGRNEDHGMTITEELMGGYRSLITRDILFLGNNKILAYFWPIVRTHYLTNLIYFRDLIFSEVFSPDPPSKEKAIILAQTLAFILYNLDHVNIVWKLVEELTTEYLRPIATDSNPIVLTFIKTILPSLYDEDVLTLWKRANRVVEEGIVEWGADHILIEKEMKRRGL